MRECVTEMCPNQLLGPQRIASRRPLQRCSHGMNGVSAMRTARQARRKSAQRCRTANRKRNEMRTAQPPPDGAVFDCTFREILNADADGKRTPLQTILRCRLPAARANDRPTAMPSGMLCKSPQGQAVRLAERSDGRLGLLLGAVQGVRTAQRRYTKPRIKPPAAGIQPLLAVLRGLVNRGNRADLDDAAIITRMESEENLAASERGLPFHKEYHGGADRGHQEGEACARSLKQCLAVSYALFLIG